MVNSTLHVAHGKAEKEFLMDLASNGSFTEVGLNNLKFIGGMESICQDSACRRTAVN